MGQSLADYAGTVGRAQSRTMDLGVIGTTLTTRQCDGSAPIAQESQLPPTLKADSRDDASRKGRSLTYLGQNGVAAGQQDVQATPEPMGRSTTSIGSLTIPGVVTAAGGTTAAVARIVDGATREATATASVPRLVLGGGVVVLENLRWAASQRTGAKPGSDASFTIGGISVGGQQLPSQTADQLAAAVTAANGALAPTGLRIDLPAVEKRGSGDVGTVALSPLALRMADSPLGNQLLGPVLGAAQPIRAQVIQALLQIRCQFSTEITVADVVIGAFAGGGSLSFEFGGVTASTDGTRYTNPLLGGSGLGGPSATIEGAIDGGVATGPLATPLDGGRPPAIVTPPAGRPAPGGQATPVLASSSGPTRTRGIVAGLLALGVLALVAGADFLRMRTPTRTIEDPA